jgi:hypothetical protein
VSFRDITLHACIHVVRPGHHSFIQKRAYHGYQWRRQTALGTKRPRCRNDPAFASISVITAAKLAAIILVAVVLVNTYGGSHQ